MTTLDNAPGLSDLADFVHEAEVHVVLPDGSIDIEALGNVQAAIDRLGQLELGIQRTPEYTYSDAAWQTVQEAADSTAIRVLVGVAAGGPLGLYALALDAGIQTTGMILRSEQMVHAGVSDDQIKSEMLNEAILYGGMAVVGTAGGQLVAANRSVARRQGIGRRELPAVAATRTTWRPGSCGRANPPRRRCSSCTTPVPPRCRPHGTRGCRPLGSTQAWSPGSASSPT